MRVEAGRQFFPEPRRLLLVGAIACAVVLLGMAFAAEAALRAWLAATFLWTGIPIGALGFLMMMRLIPGIWDDELMLPMEAATLLMPLAALAVLPVLLGASVLYGWIGQEQETAFRSVYLSAGFFVLRTVVGFAVLGALTFLLLARRWPGAVASAGLLLYVPIVSLLCIDWLMSLDPRFHSSGFGLYALSIQMTVGLAAAIVFAVRSGARLSRPQVLGALLLSALLAWAYFSFMQFFIIWSGDLPESVLWYQRRSAGGWAAVLWGIALLHAGPTLLLLFSAIRRSRTWLLAVSVAVLLGKLLEAVWLVLPADGARTGLAGVVFLLAAMIGLGAVFVAAFETAVRSRVNARGPRPARREAVS